ncbi:BTAD domain-containing putative transcriptional regulator [Aeromicrobium sp. CF4.19]|uniref:BTAD domain-containing putative transcriptional regulator n=1 Tax=Aeromicrobium sp. CF4.19 TaxID=3373082 RepID=UPI003EE50B3D
MTATTDRPQGQRLPSITHVPSRGAQVAKGLAALVGAAIVVVGVPLALLSAFGPPWPDEVPTIEWLTRPTTIEAMLSVLAVVVWLAWAHFVVCLVVEAVAERRRRGLAPQVPGGGVGTQALARRIIATIVLMAGTTSVGMGTASAAAAPQAAETAVTASVLPEAASFAEAPTQEQVGLDSAALPELDDLQSATDHDVEAGATTYYDVKPPNGRHYDTLWDIADRYLGNGLRYKEIWQLNEGVTQPDGRVMTNADLIHPGWVMKMPEDASGPGLKVVEHAPPATADESDAGASSAPGPEAAADAVPASQGGAASVVDGDGPLVRSEWQPFFGVAGGLALAGAFLGLRRHRAANPGSGSRWSLRRAERPDPTDPTPTPPTPGGGLQEEADVDGASWLDRALRSLGGASGLPAPARVSYGEAGVALSFDEDPSVPAPAGWAAPRPTTWTLGRDAAVTGSGHSPLPGLVTVGRRDDESLLLLDLESRAGVVALDGDDAVARGLALSIALDTATHPWADDRRVTLVGFADDVTSAGLGALRRSDDLGRVLESLDNVARHQRQACRSAGAADVRQARRMVPDADWTYHLVVCSGLPADADLAQLRALAEDPMVSLGVVVVGNDRDSALRLISRSDGRINAPHLGIDVAAQVLDVEAVRSLASLFAPRDGGRRPTLDQLVDVLETEDEVTDASSAVLAEVDVLGSVRVRAQGEADTEREPLLTELLTLLALHPQGVHANRISAALWPRGVDAELRDSALRQLGAWLGTSEDGAPVLMEESGVWRLTPGTVRLDWDAFREALNRAANDGRNRESHLRTALGLVRGPAFDDVPAQRYAWLEGMTTQADVALAVELTVQALAESSTSRGDLAAADGSLQRGLALLPANEELWRSRLWLAESRGESVDLASLIDEMYTEIAEHGSPVGASPATDALVDELVPGYRSSVA